MQQQPNPAYQQFLSLMNTINKKLQQKKHDEEMEQVFLNFSDAFGNDEVMADYFTDTTTIPTPTP